MQFLANMQMQRSVVSRCTGQQRMDQSLLDTASIGSIGSIGKVDCIWIFSVRQYNPRYFRAAWSDSNHQA